MPFKGIRFARSLSDKGFPVDICCDARVAGAIAHPADHSIRIDRDRIVGLYIAECDPDSGQEIYSFMLTDYYDNVTSMILGEIYLHNTEWKFNAIGNGVARDLAGLCQLYGVETN